jgi:hypothetical protein
MLIYNMDLTRQYNNSNSLALSKMAVALPAWLKMSPVALIFKVSNHRARASWELWIVA